MYIHMFVPVMKTINQSIKQAQFKSEHEKALVNILYTAGWLHVQQLQFLKPYGISLQQYNVLRILKGKYPNSICIGDIQDRMLDKMSNASRLVEKLVQKQLAQRVAAVDDRRRMDVSITPKGLDLIESMQPYHIQNIQKFMGVDEKESAELNELLDKLRTLKEIS
jgi:DNA-binding MarR family transcriptional regulator